MKAQVGLNTSVWFDGTVMAHFCLLQEHNGLVRLHMCGSVLSPLGAQQWFDYTWLISVTHGTSCLLVGTGGNVEMGS